MSSGSGSTSEIVVDGMDCGGLIGTHCGGRIAQNGEVVYAQWANPVGGWYGGITVCDSLFMVWERRLYLVLVCVDRWIDGWTGRDCRYRLRGLNLRWIVGER